MSEAPHQSRQEIIDQEHLRLLSFGYYIFGGMYILFSCFFLLYVFVGLFMMISPQFIRGPAEGHGPSPTEAAVVGLVIVGFGGLFVLLGWTVGGLMILAGRGIQQRRRRTLTYIMAGLNCLSIPFGLLLGVATFVVLARHSVSRLYEAASQKLANGDAAELN